MEIHAVLQGAGDAATLSFPLDALRESGLVAGQAVLVSVQPGRIEVVPDRPSLGLVGFAARFVDRYRSDLARLAKL